MLNEGRRFQNNFFELLDRLSPFFILNMTWVILSIPIITLPPATAGLYYATNRLTRDGDASWRQVWDGFREYFWLGWRWGGLNLLVIGILASNFWFYGQFAGGWTIWVRTFVVIITIGWGVLQLYTFPLLVEQQEKRLRTAIRNSYVIFILQPLRSLGWGLVILTIAAATALFIYPAWFFITASLCLYISNRVTRIALERIQPGYLDDSPANHTDDTLT